MKEVDVPLLVWRQEGNPVRTKNPAASASPKGSPFGPLVDPT